MPSFQTFWFNWSGMGPRHQYFFKTLVFPDDFNVKSLCSKGLESWGAYPASFPWDLNPLRTPAAGGCQGTYHWWGASSSHLASTTWFLLGLGEQTGQLPRSSGVKDCPLITHLSPGAREMVHYCRLLQGKRYKNDSPKSKFAQTSGTGSSC